jgi:hypothetical protein
MCTQAETKGAAGKELSARRPPRRKHQVAPEKEKSDSTETLKTVRSLSKGRITLRGNLKNREELTNLTNC